VPEVGWNRFPRTISWATTRAALIVLPSGSKAGSSAVIAALAIFGRGAVSRMHREGEIWGSDPADGAEGAGLGFDAEPPAAHAHVLKPL
jgi:hypothetical protein